MDCQSCDTPVRKDKPHTFFSHEKTRNRRQSGTRADLSQEYSIDPDSIVNAALLALELAGQGA